MQMEIKTKHRKQLNSYEVTAIKRIANQMDYSFFNRISNRLFFFSRPNKYYLLYSNRRLIGFGGVHWNYITALHISPPFQHKGLGSFLLQEVIKDLARHRFIYLMVANEELRGFYKQLGFKHFAFGYMFMARSERRKQLRPS